MVYTADLKSAAARIEGSSLSSRTKFGSKVFMDAHGTVTAEEWGSLPPRPAKFYLKALAPGNRKSHWQQCSGTRC